MQEYKRQTEVTQMKKTRTPRWRSRLNRGLIAIAAIALLCVVFVVAAGIYVK